MKAVGLSRVIEEQGRQLKWVAAQLDPPVHASTLSRWASLERPVPPARLTELAALLGVEPEALTEQPAA